MNNPLGDSPSKGNQGTTRGKEKIFCPRWESVRIGSLIPFTRANASELILCSTILTSPARLSFVLKVPLRYLRPSIIYSVPCKGPIGIENNLSLLHVETLQFSSRDYQGKRVNPPYRSSN